MSKLMRPEAERISFPYSEGRVVLLPGFNMHCKILKKNIDYVNNSPYVSMSIIIEHPATKQKYIVPIDESGHLLSAIPI